MYRSPPALSSSHGVWLSAEGQVFSFGLNESGQCGVPSIDLVSTPTRIESLETFSIVHVAVGGSHTAVVSSEGQLLTFGASDFGQCGHGDGGALDVRRPRLVRDLPSVATVACGESHTLVLDLSAQLHACSQGRFGALGLESLDNRARRRCCVRWPSHR